MITKIESELPGWLGNFKNKIVVQGPILGVAAAEVQSAVDDSGYLLYLYNEVLTQLRTYSQQVTSFKNLIKDGKGDPSMAFPALPIFGPAPTAIAPGALSRLRAFVARIIKLPAYTDAIGQDLDIVGSGTPSPSVPDAPPTFRATAVTAGNVILDWDKNGWTGVKVQGRLAGEANWTDLGIDLYSPFADTRPLAKPGQPEIRECRMIYLDGDATTGDWSPALSVTVTPA